MMRFMSRSPKEQSRSAGALQTTAETSALQYESSVWIDSKAAPGVRFAINRISFARRMELSRLVREISRKAEFLDAGTELHEKIEANILAQEIDTMYLQWGLASIDGLIIDGEAATTAGQLLEKGPEDLAREAVGAIKEQCGLNEAERKN
jgi:hypothetical protein